MQWGLALNPNQKGNQVGVKMGKILRKSFFPFFGHVRKKKRKEATFVLK
jgi:hypothetical protein